jgi:hypothetical protein
VIETSNLVPHIELQAHGIDGRDVLEGIGVDLDGPEAVGRQVELGAALRGLAHVLGVRARRRVGVVEGRWVTPLLVGERVRVVALIKELAQTHVAELHVLCAYGLDQKNPYMASVCTELQITPDNVNSKQIEV